jgi:hypothetical protein
VPPAPAAPDPAKEKALAEIDDGLAKFQERITNESSEVTQAAMKTRLTVLNQRRADLVKDFTPERFESLKEDLRKEVKVKVKMTPAADPNEGKITRKDLKLEAEANQAAREAALARQQMNLHQAMISADAQTRERDLELTRRDDQYRADRAAEEASRRRMEVARINSDLARLSAQIEASTVGDPNRRAELKLRLRDLEQERTRLELSAQPTSSLETLRNDIQREAERSRERRLCRRGCWLRVACCW